MKAMISLILTGAALSFGCAEQTEEKWRDRAALEGKAGAEGETAETNRRARQMEVDLARKQNFFEGVTGTFEGEMQTPRGSKFRVRFAIAPTIPRYEGSRIRTLDEIEYETNSISFDVLENTISKYDDGQELSFGCQYEKLRPSVEAGNLRLTSSECPRSFVLTLVPTGVGLQAAGDLEASGRMMASALLEARGAKASAIQVEMRSINLPDPVHFIVKRVR